MKILHTADWHLGQNFFQYDRSWEHAQFLEWISSLIKDRKVDTLLISGDVFDTANPSAASQKMYYSFLTTQLINNPGLQIIITAGNHDSANRLEAPSELLEVMRVSVRGSIARDVSGELDYDRLLVALTKGGVCLAVPYIRQGDYPLGMTYSEGVNYIYSQLTQKAKESYGAPIVAMGHLVATGSEISSRSEFDGPPSERSIIGGVEGVSPETFDGDIVYTALGHLHKGQRVSGRENVRYSGSPLAMSFAERNNKQSVVLVTIQSDNVSLEIEKIEFSSPVKLLRVPALGYKCKEEVIDELRKLPDGEINEQSPYLEVNVQIYQPEPMLKVEIEEAIKGKAVRLTRIGTFTKQSDDIKQRNLSSVDELIAMSPMDIAKDVFRKKFGGDEMPDDMLIRLNNIIEKVQL